MLDFDPGWLSRREMALTDPSSAGWPRWLRAWWGHIQPPPLMLRLDGFPSMIRLPSPSIYPSLALEVLGRWNSFLAGSLPFLAPNGEANQGATTPHFDFRMRPPPRPSRQTSQFEWGGHPAAEHAASDIEPEPFALSDTSAGERLPESEPINADASPAVRDLVPWPESEWASPEPTTETAHTLERSIQNADAWREAWSATDVPSPAAQPIGVTGSLTGITPRPVAMTNLVAAEQTPLRLEPLHDLGFALGLAPASELVDINAHITPRHSVLNASVEQQVVREPVRPPLEYRRAHEPAINEPETPEGESFAASEHQAIRTGPLMSGLEQSEAHAASAVVPHSPEVGATALAALLPGQQLPMALQDVLHRPERMFQTLSHNETTLEAMQVEHEPLVMSSHGLSSALTPGRHSEPGSATSIGLTQNEALTPAMSTALQRAQPEVGTVAHTAMDVIQPVLGTAARLADIAVGTRANAGAEAAEAVIGELPATRQTELAEVSQRPHLQPEVAVQSHETNVHGVWPRLDLFHPLESLHQVTEPSAAQVLRHVPPIQARYALAALATLPTLGPGEPLVEPVRPVMETMFGQEPISSRVQALRVAGQAGATAITSGAHVSSALGGSDLAGQEGIARVGRDVVHAGQPLVFRQSSEAANWFTGEAEHVALQAERGIQQSFEPYVLPPPRMEVRREAQTQTLPAHATSGADGLMTSQSSIGTPASAYEPLSTPGFAMAEPLPAQSAQSGGGPGAAGWLGEAPSTVTGAGPNGTPNMETLAREVFELLKAQLRAERDRHQVYDR